MQALKLGAVPGLSRKALTGFALVAAYVVSDWVSLGFGGRGRVPPFWICNAFIAALVVLVFDDRRLRPLIAVAVVCSLPAFVVFAPSAPMGLFRAALNAGEGVVTGLMALWVMGPRRLLRTAGTFARLVFFAVLPAILINWGVREMIMRLMGDADLVTLQRSGVAPHMLGMAITLPALILMVQPSPQELRRSRLETVAVIAGLALATHLVFNVFSLPSGVVLSPLMVFAAFRLGPRGAVFGHLAAALVCLPATISGGGAFALHPEWTLNQRALLYQSMILTSAFGVSFCAFMVAEQARLRRLLVKRAASARDSRRRALAANRAKGEFLATMSHEIRTPMNSIMGFTQVLLRSPGVSTSARGQVRLIAEAGGSLMTVLNDVLDFSKMEAGQIELCAEPMDPAALCAAVVEILREPAEAKGLDLRLDAGGLTGLFDLDGQRLRQVLLNLLNNGVKFTDRGEVRLAARADDDRGVLRFEVWDTGIGVDAELKDRLFTRFSQADSSTTRRYGGSGLGLAICKGLVERMGGSIGMDSRPDGGSMFWFECPARRVSGETAPSGREAAAGPLVGCVLLVDDHPMNLRLGETLLRLLGCEVDLAASGEDAVAAVAAKAYDAVLMDVHMPGMDGPATTRAIRALDGPHGMAPIIAVSADVMPQSIERCLQAGMVEHLAKPVQIKALHEALQRWMTGQNRRSAA
jgi:signal transduction histidine kinase/ActR/RegA family two-component response regulator